MPWRRDDSVREHTRASEYEDERQDDHQDEHQHEHERESRTRGVVDLAAGGDRFAGPPRVVALGDGCRPVAAKTPWMDPHHRARSGKRWFT